MLLKFSVFCGVIATLSIILPGSQSAGDDSDVGTNGYKKCDFLLNHTLIIQESDLPPECQNLSDSDRALWITENGKLDDFFVKLDDVESILGLDLDDPAVMKKKWAMRMKMYDDLEVYNSTERCRKKQELLDYTVCLIQVRDKMISWLDEFYNNSTIIPVANYN